jgi:anti-sigma B factor antagonist
MLTDGAVIEQSSNLVVAKISTPELTIRQATVVIDELMQRMRCDNARFFLLDVTSVEFIPSACLGTLVHFLQDLEHVRGRLGLVGCRPNVQFLFKVTRLDAVFFLYDDMEAAKSEIRGET